MTAGQKIKSLRKTLGLTQTELGEKLGVKKNAVSKWECGRVDDIPMSKIKSMALLFGVTASCLIDDDAAIMPREENLSDLEREIIKKVRLLSPEQQQVFLAYLITLLNTPSL